MAVGWMNNCGIFNTYLIDRAARKARITHYTTSFYKKVEKHKQNGKSKSNFVDTYVQFPVKSIGTNC